MVPSALWFYAMPLGWALFVWWLSTGVIIYLDNLPRRTHRWSMLAATVIFGASLHGLHTGSTDATAAGAYAAFTYGLLAWGWQEMSFFMGFITGPVREPCPPGCVGWPRFVRAVQACLYHELASLASAAAVVAATAGGVNQVGTWTFMVLWWMHESARLNVMLGVRNLNEEFIPDHLDFIRSFLRQRPMNLLFPFSVTIATVIAVILVQRAAVDDPVSATGTTFIAVLLILAIIEHWFLVLPLPAAALWNWSLRARQERRAAADAELAAKNRGAVRLRAGFTGAMPALAPVVHPLTKDTTIGSEP